MRPTPVPEPAPAHHPAEAAFLQTILENPYDDTPRLVYADWLEERGDPRGEFIHLQYALERTPEDDPGRPELEARERALLAEHREKWLPPELRHIVGWGGCFFRRGFVEEVHLDALGFVAEAVALYRLAPVRQVRLNKLTVYRRFEDGYHSRRSHADELAESRYLGRLAGLDVRAGSEVWSVSGVESRNLLSREDLAALLGSKHWRRLTTLVLHADLDDVAAHLLGSSAALAGLTELDLRSNRIGPAGAQALARSHHLANLRRLDLSWNESLGSRGAQALAASLHLTGLADLRLRRTSLGIVGAAALASSPNLDGLTDLDLGDNALGTAEVEALASSPSLAGLARLDLGDNGLTDAAALALAASPRLARLTTLVLGGNDFSDSAVRVLARSPLARGLTRLGLAGSGEMTDAGARALAASPALAGMVWLDLSQSQVGDGGARALAESSHLGRLASLVLRDNHIGEDGALALADSPHLTRLRRLDLSGNRVGDGAQQALRDRFGDAVEL